MRQGLWFPARGISRHIIPSGGHLGLWSPTGHDSVIESLALASWPGGTLHRHSGGAPAHPLLSKLFANNFIRAHMECRFLFLLPLSQEIASTIGSGLRGHHVKGPSTRGGGRPPLPPLHFMTRQNGLCTRAPIVDLPFPYSSPFNNGTLISCLSQCQIMRR